MVTDNIKKLAATKARLAELERTVAAQMKKELSGLHRKFGFDSVPAFLKAVKAAAGGGGGRRGRPPGGGSGGRRRRAVITAAMRARVRKMVEAGKTGAQIAKKVQISLPSVQNIKKALGLVKARKA